MYPKKSETAQPRSGGWVAAGEEESRRGAEGGLGGATARRRCRSTGRPGVQRARHAQRGDAPHSRSVGQRMCSERRMHCDSALSANLRRTRAPSH